MPFFLAKRKLCNCIAAKMYLVRVCVVISAVSWPPDYTNIFSERQQPWQKGSQGQWLLLIAKNVPASFLHSRFFCSSSATVSLNLPYGRHTLAVVTASLIVKASFQVYIKHLLAKECGAAQNSSIKVMWLPPTIQCSVITGESGSPFVPTPDSS